MCECNECGDPPCQALRPGSEGATHIQYSHCYQHEHGGKSSESDHTEKGGEE